MSATVKGTCRDLLERWLDLYGGSTCADPAEQKDMDKLDFDTRAWLSFGPYPAELAVSEIGRIEDQRASAASPSVATADSPQGAVVQPEAHPTASDTPRTLLPDEELERIWQANYKDLRQQEYRRVFEQAVAANALEREAAAQLATIREQHGTIHWQETRIEELEKEAAALRRERDEAQRQIDITQLALDDTEQHLGNLLAVIHRYGGHYRTEYGTKKAVAEAHKIWARLQQERDEAAAREREACALICDQMAAELHPICVSDFTNNDETAASLADAIRARAGEGRNGG